MEGMAGSHDVPEEDDRIRAAQHRNPRLVIADFASDGTMFWGELSRGDLGEVMDTTLTGRVLDPIEVDIRNGKNAGCVIVDGIEYAFAVSRPSPQAE